MNAHLSIWARPLGEPREAPTTTPRMNYWHQDVEITISATFPDDVVYHRFPATLLLQSEGVDEVLAWVVVETPYDRGVVTNHGFATEKRSKETIPLEPEMLRCLQALVGTPKHKYGAWEVTVPFEVTEVMKREEESMYRYTVICEGDFGWCVEVHAPEADEGGITESLPPIKTRLTTEIVSALLNQAVPELPMSVLF